MSEGKGHFNTKSYHGVPDKILDGIFAEKDKNVVKACPLCGCKCKDHSKENMEKEKRESIQS